MNLSDHTLEPVRLFAADRFLTAGHVERLPANVERIDDLDRAMLLENSQEPPAGHRIWNDALSGAVSAFYSSAEGRAGRALIEAEADRVWTERGAFERAIAIKRIGKTATRFDYFWLAVAYDSLERLKMVALGRHVLGRANPPLLEAVFAVYDAGFHPCGVRHDGTVCAFDPRSLSGFDALLTAA